jgi:hypothetical protein
MTPGVPPLSNAQLLAFGRVAWAAINLESRAVDLCEKVLHVRKRDTGTPVSTLVKKAMSRLAESTHSGAVDPSEAIGWLKDALRLIQTRNEILHSRLVVAYAGSLDSENSKSLLMHHPDRSKANPQPVGVLTDISADYLNSIAEEIGAVLERWEGADVTIVVAAGRPVN